MEKDGKRRELRRREVNRITKMKIGKKKEDK